MRSQTLMSRDDSQTDPLPKHASAGDENVSDRASNDTPLSDPRKAGNRGEMASEDLSDAAFKRQAGPGQLSEEDQPTIISENPPLSYPQSESRVSEIARKLQGQMLDHYRLDRFIGGGGMGVVFKAHDTLLSRTVAVKILSRTDDDPETLRRFSNEAQSAAKLDHENIARVFFVGQDHGWSYIVFEFVEGQNLRQMVMEQGPLSLDLIMRYMYQLVRAVDHAATRKVIHRDIKPSNVLVTEDHRVKLVDMGLARTQRLNADQEDMTASGMTLGTFDYISPEQARDPRNADTRSDIYSLGCTFYFLLTAAPPFPDGTPIQKLLSHQEAPRPDIAQRRPETPESIKRIVLKQIAPNPADRYQTADELLADLLVVSSELQIDVGLKEPLIIEPLSPTRSRTRPLISWVLPTLALVASILFFELAFPKSNDSEASLTPTYKRQASAKLGLTPPETRPDPNREATTNRSPNDVDDTSPDEGEVPDSEPRAGLPSMQSGPPSMDGEESPEAEATPTIRRLRVGADLAEISEAANLETFEQAIEMANQDDSIETIELCFNGFVPIQPIRMESRKLNLVAGDGYRPGLRWTAESDLLETPHFAQVFSEEFRVEGIEFEIVLASETSWSQISCFHLEQNYSRYVTQYEEAPIQDFSFIDCQFTVIETKSVPVSDLPNLSIFEINRPESFFLELPTVDVAQFPNLLLSRLWVRGNCHLLRAAPATPFYAKWERSLFISSKVACMFGGVPASDGEGNMVALSPSQMVLDQVTMASPGLMEVRVAESSPDAFQIDIEASRSWLAIPSQKPLLYHRLLRSDRMQQQLVSLSGRENLIPENTLLWRIDVAGSPEASTYLTVSGENEPWNMLTATQLEAGLPPAIIPFLSNQRRPSQFQVTDLAQIYDEAQDGQGEIYGVSVGDLKFTQSSGEPAIGSLD